MSRYFVSKGERREHQQQKVRKNKRPWRDADRDEKPEIEEAEEEKDPFPGDAPVPAHKLKKYKRGKALQVAGIRTVQGAKKYKKLNKKYGEAVRQSARAELLLPEETGYLEADGDEETCEISQQEISSAVDITSATKVFDLNLEFGPYCFDYSRNGRYLLLGGKAGHVAAIDWVTKKLLCETNVMESVHCVKWLHMPTMYAVSQKGWVYIYDIQGIELHCIKKLFRVSAMEFLPYHFLLATAQETGYLSWLDVSIGKMVAQFHAKQGALKILCQNPYNATLLTGHSNGTVLFWTPNVHEPVVKMLCHQHPICAITVDTKGNYLATSSVDKSLKIWDVRTYKCLQSYRLGGAADCLSFSQTGLLSIGMKDVVEVYKGCCTQTVETPYMRHSIDGYINSVKFCPFEDVLGIGNHKGFSSILIPGAGEPNFDAYEMNPFMTKSQRKEMEVKMLLEKIQPEMITLDPMHLGQVDVKSLNAKLEEKKKTLPKTTAEARKSKEKLENPVQKKTHKKEGVLDRFKPKN